MEKEGLRLLQALEDCTQELYEVISQTEGTWIYNEYYDSSTESIKQAAEAIKAWNARLKGE